jgi:selenocysteine-specific elongation factor
VERHLVVGTAGHIDHGKTALVKALTGVDTDRLEEEKRRGITIDLGFAPLALAGFEASVVDVPGHEGFIRNMVAGATGVDLALLVVAADEGVMPQTTEHLAILRFLGVSRGVVALTKCDLAPDADWRALVAGEIREKVTAAFGRDWPVIEVSAVTGAGLDALRAALAEEGSALGARPAGDRFRLPVDRAFALPGAGTIVTGTVWSGSAAEGDRLTILPSGFEARVRSIEVHDRAAPRALPGRRTALALVGPSHEQVARGDMVVSGEGWRASQALDVTLTLLPEAAAKLKPRLRVRVNHGTAEVLARVALPAGWAAPEHAAAGAPEDLEAGPAAGGIAVRLLLESPLVARAGDRFVVRSYSPVTTIGGGVVVDPWADERVLARARGKQAFPAMPAGDAERLVLLVGRRAGRGMARSELEVAAGLDAQRFAAALGIALEEDLVVADGRLFAAAEVVTLAEKLAEVLARFHTEHPLEAGMPAQSWRAAAGTAPEPLVDLAERRLITGRLVQRDGSVVRRAQWAPKLGGTAERLRADLLRALTEAAAEPPSTAELAAAHPGADVPGLLRLMAREGVVVAVGKERFYEAGALARERDRIVTLLTELGSATPSALRDRLGLSRKWLIPLLEWCDAQGITVRKGDARVLGSPRPA